MSSLDGQFFPFRTYPGYKLMAPCMRDCEEDLPFNGCDNSGCWCKKNNLDRRISQLERCASTSCTFADMNTKTDVSAFSGIQVQYCVDRDLSPAGMALPTMVPAETTSDGGSIPSETGGALSTPDILSSAGTTTRSRPSSGPSNTGTSQPTSTSDSSSSSNSNAPSPSNDALSTAAKAGIAIGAVLCVLIALLIALLLLRRRKRHNAATAAAAHYPPSYTPHAPPNMASAPGPAPYSPAPPAPLSVNTTGAGAGGFGGATKPDVSPVSEKTPAFTAMPVARKEVAGEMGRGMSPPAQVGSPAPTEVSGSAVPERHEVHSESTGTSVVSGHGHSHAQGQGQGRWVYEVSGQGGAVELGGGEEEGRGLFR